MRDEAIGPWGACGRALRVLASGPDEAGRKAWRQARDHAANCAACQDRLGRLATAILSADAGEVPCAECQTRLPDWLAVRARGDDPAPVMPLTAAHLADCPRCATILSLLAPTAADWTGAPLPVPPRYPRFDTSFLEDRRRAGPGLAARWTALLDRIVTPGAGRPHESPVSIGVLGVALAAIALLAVLAGTWVVLQPSFRPLPLAPLNRATTVTATGQPTVTATLTATARPLRGSPAPASGATPVLAGPTSAATATAQPEPTERRRPPLLAPSPQPTEEPYPGWQEPPTREPYPGPSDEPTGAPYPGPTDLPPTVNPYP